MQQAEYLDVMQLHANFILFPSPHIFPIPLYNIDFLFFSFLDRFLIVNKENFIKKGKKKQKKEEKRI